jgi:AraC-like DNA-binding protein
VVTSARRLSGRYGDAARRSSENSSHYLHFPLIDVPIFSTSDRFVLPLSLLSRIAVAYGSQMERGSSVEVLGFVQRCQVVAWPWALSGSPEFDLVEAIAELIRCLRTVPLATTHRERAWVSSALLRMMWNVQRQLPTAAPKGPYAPHMPRRLRARVAVATMVVQRNGPDVEQHGLAASVGVSEGYVSHLLNNEMGLHFDTLLHGLRLVDAVIFLRTSPRPIYEIALACGYRETKCMDRIFRAWFHMTPSAFRTAVPWHTPPADARMVVRESAPRIRLQQSGRLPT